MAASLRPVMYFLFRHCLLLTILHRSHSETLEAITSAVPLRDGDVILSDNKNFALGFISPGNSTRRYLGTWYNKISEKTVYWVANRDIPINDTSGILSIDSNGSLILNCCNNKALSVWFADIPNMVSSNDTIAQLDDMGNFILVEALSSRILWQSFDHPTDTIMPFMKLGWANRIDRTLTSWKSTDDPGVGNYTHGIDLTGYPQTFLNRSGVPYWRGGPWTGQRWSGVPAMANPYIFNISFVNNQDEVSIEFGLKDRSILTRKVLEPSGLLQTSTWNARSGRWIQYWAVPVEQCDFYGTCGPNSNCNPYNTDQFACTCLPGFEPKSPAEWFLRDGSDGCIRSNATSSCQIGEGFVRVARVKAPDTSQAHANMNMSLKECEQACLKNCTCTAYMAADERSEFGCLAWYGDLLDTRTFSDIGQDLYVRVDASTLAQYASSKGSPAKWIIGTSASVTAVLLLLLSIFLLKIRKRRGRLKSFVTPIAAYFRDDESYNKHDLNEETGKQDSPLFDLETIAVATDNFSFANKLGEGGFGSVYKGVLDDGKEIAVKRLSKSSGQGLEEFKNEVAVIAKLQHRNLVKTLGCCIEGNEKMLIYEYMPNKSLDAFLFDEEKKSLLDWRKRFEIATGIARGILYLHQDSTLRIIHRDLKTTNVLLDSSMCPKISDFGMARICGGDQVEGFTRRVVGTYGYVSPEYAMRGLFSVKSDVYSFGIVLLEIISGKRNSSFHQDNSSIHLIDHVWKTWKEGSCFDIADPSMLDMYPENEVLRCIQIGLLCVQEFPMDRPTMSSVVFMLENNGNLPTPKKPAFTLQRMMPGRLDTSLSNDISFTVVEAR